MTRGFAYVICEFALIDRRGNIRQQRTVNGYSKIQSLNSEYQREYAYENAVNHARSKYLYSIHKPSDENVDFAVVDYGFRTEYHEKKVRKFKESSKTIKSKKRQEINVKVLEKADAKRNDEDKKVTQNDIKNMYKKPNHHHTDKPYVRQGYQQPKAKKRTIKRKSIKRTRR